jgi:hypothetical protein
VIVDKPDFAKTSAESGHKLRRIFGGPTAQESDQRFCGLLPIRKIGLERQTYA